jgi:ribosomal protein L7/L12
MITLTQEEADEMRAGRKIGAIRLVRNRLGLNLPLAKQYVEKWDGKMVDDDRKRPCPRCQGEGFVEE